MDLGVFDVQGRRVATLVHGSRPAGRAVVSWNGTNDGGAPVGSGVYFYRLTAGNDVRTRKMVLMK